MAYTQADIDAFERAIVDSKGALSITFSDRTVTFASLRERAEYLATMRAQLAASTSSAGRIRYASTSKGV